MELFKSLEKRTKLFNDPFKHFEINQPLTNEAVKEISNADIADPKKENLNYDGTRAIDGGDGAFRLAALLLLRRRKLVADVCSERGCRGGTGRDEGTR